MPTLLYSNSDYYRSPNPPLQLSNFISLYMTEAMNIGIISRLAVRYFITGTII